VDLIALQPSIGFNQE